MIDESVIAEVGRRLAAAAGESAQVILFGSHARGDAGSGATSTSWLSKPEVDNEADESVRLLRELRDLRVSVDVIVVSSRDAEEWRDVRGGIVHTALGKVASSPGDGAAARTLLDADSSRSIMGFHCRQAIGKALLAERGVLRCMDAGREFPKSCLTSIG